MSATCQTAGDGWTRRGIQSKWRLCVFLLLSPLLLRLLFFLLLLPVISLSACVFLLPPLRLLVPAAPSLHLSFAFSPYVSLLIFIHQVYSSICLYRCLCLPLLLRYFSCLFLNITISLTFLLCSLYISTMGRYHGVVVYIEKVWSCASCDVILCHGVCFLLLLLLLLLKRWLHPFYVSCPLLNLCIKGHWLTSHTAFPHVILLSMECFIICGQLCFLYLLLFVLRVQWH